MKEIKNITSIPAIILEYDGMEKEPLDIVTITDGIEYLYDCGIVVKGTLSKKKDIYEWKWKISNRSKYLSPKITKFRPLHFEMPCNGVQAPRLHFSTGGLDFPFFPPVSWAQQAKSIITEGLSQFSPMTLSSFGGRSSNKELPFFIVEDITRKCGVFIGIGWSGDWDLSIVRIGEKVIFNAGMTNISLSLKPKESFIQPTVLVGFYEGDVADGQRLLRRYLRDNVQPKLNGKPLGLTTFFDNYYGDRGNFDGNTFLDEMPLAKYAGIEYLVLDGGWTGGGEDSLWESLAPNIGSWRPCNRKFPDGFKPLVNTAHKYDRKLGIWFDIERANEKSLAYLENPELFFSGLKDNDCYLIRLDKSEALEWALDNISKVIKELNGKWIRFDFNSNPAQIWKAIDTPGRRGETEIKYIENLYKLYDKLIERFPDMVIENCATGGRRIDLETIRRSHTDWISDHSQSEAIIRYHIHGASRWLPANHINTSLAHAFMEPNRSTDWFGKLPASAYLSHFGGNFSISDRMSRMKPEGLKTLKHYIDLFSLTGPCFCGDIYPIGRQDGLLEGPAGLGGIDNISGRRAMVLFGVKDGTFGDYIPEELQSLARKKPLAGDNGNEQFTSAYLWADE